MSTPTLAPGVFEPSQFSKRQVVYAIAVVSAIGISPFLFWPSLADRLLTSNFLPHLYCYLGKPGLVWTHAVADSLIGLAYVAISATLAHLVYKGRRDIPFHWMFLAFGLFIVACGGTHFMEVVTIWIPVYVLSGGVKVFTAVVSVATAVSLPATVPRVLTLVQKAKASDSAFEHAAIGMAWFAADGRWLKVNRALCNLLGYSSEELLAKRFQDITYPDDLEADLEYVRQMLASEIRSYQVEKRYFHKAGHIVWALLSVSLVRDEGGQELYFISQIQDITERKRVENEIRDLNRQMERQNTELIAINKELESFSYSVSHDLRAPLRAIDGFSLALLQDCQDRLGPAEKEHLERVRAAAEHMGRLIDDMLNLARTARCELVRGKVDLSALAREILSAFQKAEPERRVTSMIAPDLTVEGDRTLLRVVIENLLGNAWKYTSKRPAARVEFGVQDEGGKKVYFVRDNGAGFDMKYADKLFGAFQRLHDGSEFPGSGIGLATVQRIIHRHGGQVWAEGAVGQGATFYFVVGAGDEKRALAEVPRGREVLSEKS